ncbi:MAG: 16S rRNA (guanine(527)-N(7))-methyltransferase RsmG [Phycisphaerales bacterium]|jgi:16S rRNA (guanine527-N7)-methyltransferase|nr:16S rRNA (guanine(527)-N(7))-methyltransferase RsmG [Phycisphaerales bacterium]
MARPHRPHPTRPSREATPPPPREPAWTVPSPLPAPLTPPESFLAKAKELGLEFDEGDLSRLSLYLALLLDANNAFNLTAIRDPAEAWTRHILDSLTLIPVLAELPENSRVIDVGSGGGLPGIPLAITMPSHRFTLLEATGKKAAFLNDLRAPLSLSNTEVLNQRAESAAHLHKADGHREKYAAAVARAVGPLAVIAELTCGFVEVGGIVALIKGEKADQEIEEGAKALSLLGLSHAGTIPTPTGRIVVLNKEKTTPRTYPRADGEPKRVPLGVKRS